MGKSEALSQGYHVQRCLHLRRRGKLKGFKPGHAFDLAFSRQKLKRMMRKNSIKIQNQKFLKCAIKVKEKRK